MTFMVTWKTAPKVGQIKSQQFASFDNEDEARTWAENMLKAANTEVQVWGLVASPTLTQRIDWNAPGQFVPAENRDASHDA